MILKKINKRKVKGYKPGGYVMPENTEQPGPLFADQLTTYGNHNLLRVTKKARQV
jgi:hypothetical protein